MLKKIENISLLCPPILALWLTLINSNYPCLKHISMVSKLFEPFKFYVYTSVFKVYWYTFKVWSGTHFFQNIWMVAVSFLIGATLMGKNTVKWSVTRREKKLSDHCGLPCRCIHNDTPYENCLLPTGCEEETSFPGQTEGWGVKGNFSCCIQKECL